MGNNRPQSVTWFAVAAASPLVLFAAAVVLGGFWPLVALFYMTGFAVLIDVLVGKTTGAAPEGAEFPAADRLLVCLAIGHLAILPMVVWAVAGTSGLAGWQRAVLFFGAGLWMGQVAHPAAHELIHRSNRTLFRFGVAVYTSLLIGHHVSAHRLVHHRFVASGDDPNTARPGEVFWRFLPRAWTGSFRDGWDAESARGNRRGVHPYAIYIGGAGVALGCGFLLAGWPGVAVWAALAAHAQMQIFLSDYVQHYGLIRNVQPDGRLEPVGTRHSWNAPHWFSARMMLNAPRHSDHHAHPARPYPALRLPPAEEGPELPWPLPVACTIALVPSLWRRGMRPHLARWRRPTAQA